MEVHGLSYVSCKRAEPLADLNVTPNGIEKELNTSVGNPSPTPTLGILGRQTGQTDRRWEGHFADERV